MNIFLESFWGRLYELRAARNYRETVCAPLSQVELDAAREWIAAKGGDGNSFG